MAIFAGLSTCTGLGDTKFIAGVFEVQNPRGTQTPGWKQGWGILAGIHKHAWL